MGEMVMLIGPRGGGKTTMADWFVQDMHQQHPSVPIISNVPIENAIYVPDIIKFLKVKLMVEGGEKSYVIQPDMTAHIVPKQSQPTFMLIIIDEAAISGFESRGSGLYSVDTYLLALSRKLHVIIILVSQLMSMVDRRGQWLSDYFWFCEAHMREGSAEVDYFSYKIYDEELRYITTFILSSEDAKQYLFGKFDTDDIPNYSELAIGFRNQKNIRQEDQRFFNQIVEYYRNMGMAKQVLQSKRDEWFSSRWTAFWAMAEEMTA